MCSMHGADAALRNHNRHRNGGGNEDASAPASNVPQLLTLHSTAEQARIDASQQKSSWNDRWSVIPASSSSSVPVPVSRSYTNAVSAEAGMERFTALAISNVSGKVIDLPPKGPMTACLLLCWKHVVENKVQLSMFLEAFLPFIKFDLLHRTTGRNGLRLCK